MLFFAFLLAFFAYSVNARAIATVNLIEGLPSLSPFQTFGNNLASILNSTSHGIMTLSDSQVKTLGLAQAEMYASAAYCPVVRQGKWACGRACQPENSTVLLGEGGDNQGLPYWFIAFNPTEKMLVVSHQGTNRDSWSSILNDIKVQHVNAKDYGFEGAGKAHLHEGFTLAHRATIDQIYGILKTETSTGGTAETAESLVVIGHSLGAAISQLDAMYFSSRLPKLQKSMVLFGCPRVGDKLWADYVDKTLGTSFVRINNQNDVIPHVPGPPIFDYTHPSNEVWLQANGTISLCRGQDSDLCSNSLWNGTLAMPYSIAPHSGPYFDGTHVLGECKRRRSIK